MARQTQFDSVPIPKRVQLTGPFDSRDNTFEKSVRIVNGYAERDPTTGEYQIYKRPGFSTTQYVSGGGVGKGVYFFESSPGIGKLISIVGNDVFSHNLITLAGTNIGSTVVGASGFNSFVTVPGAGSAQELVFGDGTTAYFTDGTTVTQILGADDFPTGTNSFRRGWGYLDGFLFVLVTPREIRGTTNLDDPAIWDLLNSIQARSEPDYGVYLTKHLNYIIALKQWTSDFFYNAGNPTGSPLSYVRGASLPYGLLNAGAIQEIDGALIWISTNRSSGPQVMLLDRMQPSIVSTPAIDRMLRAGSGDNWFSSVIKLGGHKFFTISTQNIGFTLVYDISENLWYQWTNATGGRWTPTQVTYMRSSIVPDAWTYVAQDITGNLFFMDEDYIYPNDAGTIVPLDIYTPRYDAGTKRSKQLAAMLFSADRIQGMLEVRHNDRDYDPAAWSNFRTVDLSIDVPQLTDCGSFTSRAWNFRYKGNTAFRMKTVDLQIDIGTI
jgi:hypothetical protein